MVMTLLIALEFKHSIIRVALRRESIVQVKTAWLITVKTYGHADSAFPEEECGPNDSVPLEQADRSVRTEGFDIYVTNKEVNGHSFTGIGSPGSAAQSPSPARLATFVFRCAGIKHGPHSRQRHGPEKCGGLCLAVACGANWHARLPDRGYLAGLPALVRRGAGA